ncbi:MAG: 4-coumarate--CoA ligase family protein, partial [Comamonadaceae bacterium]
MMITSPFDDVDIPDVTLFDLLFGTLDEADLDRTALIDSLSGTTTTYRALVADIEGLAGALAAAGVATGSVVALFAPNSAAFVIAFHAILRAGAAATTVNALFTAADVAKQLRDSGATMLITVDALAPTAQQSAEQAGIDGSAVVVVDGPGKQVDGHPNLTELLALRALAPTIDIDASRHVAVLPYSSGTTGMAKGVMLTHRNLVANVAQIGPALDLRQDDRILALLPFFHIYGMTVLLNASMAARAALVAVPKFELEQLLQTIQDHRVTFAFIAPPVALVLAKNASVDRYDLSSLEVVLS